MYRKRKGREIRIRIDEEKKIPECRLTQRQRIALNMIQEGIPSRIISTVASIPEQWVIELKSLFHVELCKRAVRPEVTSQKVIAAIKMILDKIDVGIIRAVAGFPEKDIIQLKNRIEATQFEKNLYNNENPSKPHGKSLFFCRCSSLAQPKLEPAFN